MMSGCNISDFNAHNWEGVEGWTHGEGDIEGGCRRVGTWGGCRWVGTWGGEHTESV